jgi:serine/threonine protein phosphatase PrpC
MKYLQKIHKYNYKISNIIGGADANIATVSETTFIESAQYQNIGGRPYQEDRNSIINDINTATNEKFTVLSVFDGHGGAGTSEYLVQNLPPRCVARIKVLPNFVDPVQIMMIVSEEMIVIDMEAVPGMRQKFMGSTGVVCVVTNSFIITTNIADSPAILFKTSSEIIGQTPIHDCNNPTEFTRINEDDQRPLCQIQPSGTYRLNLGMLPTGPDNGLDMTRAFGDNAYKPKANVMPISQLWNRVPGQILCLCSDSFLERKLLTYEPQTIPEIVPEILSILIPNALNVTTSVQQIVDRRATTVRGDNTTMILAKM